MNDNMKKHFYAFVIALTRQNASSYIYMKLHIGYGISKKEFSLWKQIWITGQSLFKFIQTFVQNPPFR